MAKVKDPLVASMRILKTFTCPSLSGKAEITYQIGCTPESEVHLRVVGNTGGGFFNSNWVAMKDIQEILGKYTKEDVITSFVLAPLFKHKSVNTPSFLWAALEHEKWLRRLKGKTRGHELYKPEIFTAKVEKLLAGKPRAKAKRTTKRATKKAATKKKTSMVKRKTS